MRLVNIEENRVSLELEAADCLMLACALDYARDAIGGHLESRQIPLYAYTTAMCAVCEAAGMGADVYMKVRGDDVAGYTLDSVRQDFQRKARPA